MQWVLVLLGSTCYSIIQERRRVVWSRINPSTVNLLQEDVEESEKESTLFEGGFLQRAVKRLEEKKSLAKMTGARSGRNPSPKCQWNPNDLRCFLEKGASARYEGRNPQYH